MLIAKPRIINHVGEFHIFTSSLYLFVLPELPPEVLGASDELSPPVVVHQKAQFLSDVTLDLRSERTGSFLD